MYFRSLSREIERLRENIAMTAQRGMLSLLLAMSAAGGSISVSHLAAAAADGSVCTDDDGREECSNNAAVVEEVEVEAITATDDPDCADDDDGCKTWAAAGECDKNPDYMLYSCRRSCAVCHYEIE